MTTRKAFQELQTSANDRTVFVGSPQRTSTIHQVIKNSAKPKMLKSSDKENVMVRRSKRKGTVVENKIHEEQLGKTREQSKKIAKEMSKKPVKEITKKSTKNVKSRNKKENIQSVSDINTTVLLNQSRLESFLSPSSSNTTISEETTLFEAGDITVSKSISEETNLLSSDITSQSYWKTVAEERQIALEKVLSENELLLDQVLALQTENSQIKSALSAAEKILKMEGLLD